MFSLIKKRSYFKPSRISLSREPPPCDIGSVMAIHYSLAAIILTGSMASTGIAATTWTSATPDLSHTSQYLCTGWSFCLGEAGSRLITTSTPHSQPMDAEVRLTSIDFNLREARKNGTGLLIVQHSGGIQTIIGKSDNTISTGNYASGTWTFTNGPILNTGTTYYAMFTETDLSAISIGDCWDNDFFSINGSRRIDNSMDNTAGTGPSVNQLALVGSNWQKDFIAITCKIFMKKVNDHERACQRDLLSLCNHGQLSADV